MISRGTTSAVVGIALSVAAALSAGAVYQAVAARRDESRYRRPSELVDVGGHRLHLRVSGKEKEGPTIVLENGLGFPSLTWSWVQQEVAPLAPVVVYDRAGSGWSEPGPAPRDAARLAAELRAALDGAGVNGPFVIVAHSFGGLLARVFADSYAEDVAGMVLVDSAHPDELDRSPAQRQGLPSVKQAVKVSPILARLGVLRLGFTVAEWVRAFPPEQAAEIRALLASPRTWEAAHAELSAWEDLVNPEVRRAGSLGTKPLMVLTASGTSASDPIHGQLQAELAALSSNSLLRVIEGAGHESIVLEREHARKVAGFVRQLVGAARTGEPLADPR